MVHRRGTKLKHLTTYLIITATLVAFDAPRTSVLRNDNGFIDYANRVIVSRGTASVTAKETSQGDLQLVEKNLKLSKGEARARARENLLDLVKLVNFDGRTVGEMMVSDPLTESMVETLVGSAFQQGEIEYLEKKGFPPLLIRGKQIAGCEISITGDVSSQFISALLMIAPILKKGLKLTIMPPILSRPYIQMTLSLKKKVGIKHNWENNTIIIANQAYNEIDFTVENDWSSSSFLYSLASLSQKSTIEIPNLFKDSLKTLL